jgi:hypothetical protein
MRIDELEQRLDAIGWREQVDAELSERPGIDSPPDPAAMDAQLRALGAEVDEPLLDALEQEPGYTVWCLRLAAAIDPQRGAARARRHLDSTNWTLRQWAQRLAGAGSR